jgi:hypothetical protein
LQPNPAPLFCSLRGQAYQDFRSPFARRSIPAKNRFLRLCLGALPIDHAIFFWARALKLKAGACEMAKPGTFDPAREAYQEWMQGRLELWKTGIKRIRANLLVMNRDARMKRLQQLQDIEYSYEKTEREFERLTRATGGKWEDARQAVTAAADRVRRGIAKVIR